MGPAFGWIGQSQFALLSKRHHRFEDPSWGIFVEASPTPNMVDQNFIWDTHGRGIYEHDSCRQVFAHNFIGKSSAGWTSSARQNDRPPHRRARPGIRPAPGLEQYPVSEWQTGPFLGQPSEIDGNLSTGISATLDRQKLQLLWSVQSTNLSASRPVPGITHDFWGKPRAGLQTSTGPFGRQPAQAERIDLVSPALLTILGSDWPNR